MAKRLTYDEVKNYIEIESNSKCKLISKEYEKTTSKLKLLCECKEEFIVDLRTFKHKNKRQCDNCGGRRKLSYDSVKKFIEIESKSECILISNIFSKSKDKLDIYCKCGNEFSVSFDRFYSQNKRQCNQCSMGIDNTILSPGELKLSYDYVNDYIKSKSCTLLSKEYINSNAELIISCPCSKTFTTSFTKFKDRNKTRCNKCSSLRSADNQRMSNDAFSCKVIKLVGEEYQFLEEYVNFHTKIKVKHIECGHVFKVSPSNFLGNKSKVGTKCPRCKRSKGEFFVEKILKDSNLKYIMEKRFSRCKNIIMLPFDFYVNERIIIEYDGELHFNPARFSKDKKVMEEKLKYHQINDVIKNKYCIDNHIPLIRIPYTQQSNIEYILNNVLIHFGLIENANKEYDKEIVCKYLVDINWNHDKYIEENK